MNKIICHWIKTLLPLIVFNLVVIKFINPNNHIAPRVVYWISGAFTSFVIINEINEFKSFKYKNK